MAHDKALAVLAEHRAAHLEAVRDTKDIGAAIELALRSESAVLSAMFDAEKADFEANRDAYVATFNERYEAAKASIAASVTTICRASPMQAPMWSKPSWRTPSTAKRSSVPPIRSVSVVDGVITIEDKDSVKTVDLTLAPAEANTPATLEAFAATTFTAAGVLSVSGQVDPIEDPDNPDPPAYAVDVHVFSTDPLVVTVWAGDLGTVPAKNWWAIDADDPVDIGPGPIDITPIAVP